MVVRAFVQCIECVKKDPYLDERKGMFLITVDSIYQGPYTFDPSTVAYIREKPDEFDDMNVTFSNGESHFFYRKNFLNGIKRYNELVRKDNESRKNSKRSE